MRLNELEFNLPPEPPLLDYTPFVPSDIFDFIHEQGLIQTIYRTSTYQ